MAAEFKSVALFGGAMRADLPNTFEDVSDIRQVPDQQEVYLDRDGFGSIIVDILERVGGPIASSDLDALRYHLSDIVGDDAAGLRVWNTGEAHFAKLPEGTPAYSLIFTSSPGENQRGRPNEPVFVGILLTLVRLVDVKTDLVIAVNIPHLQADYDPAEIDPGQGRFGKLIEAGMAARERILQTFEVLDWALFVQDA